MNAPEVISLVSIGSGALVAITGPLVTSWREDRRAKRQANDVRLDELRHVLDEAALALAGAERAMVMANIALTSERDLVKGKAEIETMDAEIANVHRAEARLGVRLGAEHPIATVFASTALGLVYGIGSLRQQTTILRDATDLHAEYLSRMDAEYQWHNGKRRVIAGRREFTRLSAAVVGPHAPASAASINLDEDESVPSADGHGDRRADEA